MQTTEPQTTAWQDISELQKLDLKDLQAEYDKQFGKPTKSRNRKFLFAQLSKKLQETSEPASGEKPAASALTVKFQTKRKRGVKREKTEKKKPTKKRVSRALGTRDSRLPKAGTTLTKTYKGKNLRVRVMEKGFEYDGKPFRSLSAVAKKVTGQIWNGFLFFGLIKLQTKKG
jgi:hypothetical protein